MLRNWLITVVLNGAIGSTHASEWIQAIDTAESATSVDAESLTREGNIAKAWVRVDFKKPQNYGNSSKQVTSYTMRWIFNCVKGTTATGEGTGRSADGAVVFSNPRQPTKFEEVPPDTVAEGVMSVACSRKK